MNELLDLLPTTGPFAAEDIAAALRAAAALAAGMILGRFVSRWGAPRGVVPQHLQLLRRGAGYLFVVLGIAWALRELGFSLGALLGAAGLFTVAIGFAAQTSVSNIISGLFLISERPFGVGDTIGVGATLGQVHSIDLLSVRIRTFDNVLVRIPNETMLKSEVTNFTHWPIRRFDIPIGVAYGADLDQVESVLMNLADTNPACLEEPRPFVWVKGFGDSSVDLLFSVWTQQAGWLDFKSSMVRAVKQALDANGIEIPFPQRTLHIHPTSGPLSLRQTVPGDAGER